jgi:geranylgeranyl pyrophosphate synthase
MPGKDIDIVKITRKPQENIPQSKQQRQFVRTAARHYVQQHKPVGPLGMDELKKHCKALLKQNRIDEKYMDFTAVLLNNEVWRTTVAKIPFQKRLLLLPKCFRDLQNCRGRFDEIGLVCEHCGNCLIDEFSTQAQQLGYSVLVAEGSPVVMSLIETGKIEVVIGVSCLNVLENVFPYMEAGAVPGIAVPLLYDGCEDTRVDTDWVWEAIYEISDNVGGWLNIEKLRRQVSGWFKPDLLTDLIKLDKSDVESIGFDWLVKAGKRWRPFLTAGVYETIAPDSACADELKKTCIAVECFHKASLIHDDIEDGDQIRYGQMTVHAEFGIGIGLNVGDFLLGEGYRLLTGLNIADKQKVKMLETAAWGHRQLCIGQGAELSWMRTPKCLTVKEVIDIFSNKTAPAFAVALELGAILAGDGGDLTPVLRQYSQSLGIAYQIYDDLMDFPDGWGAKDSAMRPSVLFAMAHEKAQGKDKKLLKLLWQQSTQFSEVQPEVESIFSKLKIQQHVCDLMESYKLRAMNCLCRVDNSALKSLLRRVIWKIFGDVKLMGCCDEHKASNAGRRRSGKNDSV